MATALITGAGGALGRAIAIRLAADGHRIAALDVDQNGLAETTAALEAAGGQTTPVVADLRDTDTIERTFLDVSAELGPIGILVNNAAVYPSRPFLEVPPEEYDEVVTVNQRAYWLAAQAAARQMVAAGRGSIVNVASLTVHGALPGLAAYVSTKGAAVALTRALARELGPHEIRVNSVSPGAFKTAAEAIHADPVGYQRYVLENQALKRRGTPEELANAVAFLAGDEASFVTGHCLEVNGGWVMA